MKIKKILLSAVLAFTAISSNAQNCELPIAVRLDDDFCNIPAESSKMLYQSLMRMATQNGLATEAVNTPFILTAHCDVVDKSNLPGPPIQTVYNLGVTLYIADTYTQKKFATAYLTLKGVGNGETKSYINAFSRLNGNRSEVQSLIEEGKAKMMRYYDTQYPTIINEAKRLAGQQQYEEALMMVMAIPACSKGGEAATKYCLQLYGQYLDRLNLILLNRANAIWSAGQTQADAKEACSLLAQIDPDASCYGDALKMMESIKKQVRSDIDFEMRQKYNDQIELEHARIEAIRAIGVAYGKGQQPTTTNLMWLR